MNNKTLANGFFAAVNEVIAANPSRDLGLVKEHAQAVDIAKAKTALEKDGRGHRFAYCIGGERKGIVVVGCHGWVRVQVSLLGEQPCVQTVLSASYETHLSMMATSCDVAFEHLVQDLICMTYPIKTLIDMLEYAIDHPAAERQFAVMLGDLRELVQPGIDAMAQRFSV